MIGADAFTSVFGGQPQHTADNLPQHLRAIIRAGWSPVLCPPMSAEAGCILSPAQAKRAGEHPCGSAHVIDDPAKVSAIVKHWLARYDGANVALHLGRSRLAVFKAASAPGMTVQVPGELGHWWLSVPEGREVRSRQNPDWSLLSGDRYVLVPPARTHYRSSYQLVGGIMPAAPWMLG